MLIMCLDSSGRDLKTGLYESGRCLAESRSDSMGNHSEKIIFEIQKVLESGGKKLDDVSRLAINLGPGSFTGLRIGLAALAGISLALEIPLTGFNAFEIMLEDIADKKGHYLGVIACRGNEFYSANLISDGNSASISKGYRIINPAIFETSSEKMNLIGSGAGKFMEKSPQNLKEMLKIEPEFAGMPSLKSLAFCASANVINDHGNHTIPELFYIAPSQAEVNYARRRARDTN